MRLDALLENFLFEEKHRDNHVRVLEELMKIYNEYHGDDLFVHFSDINKLGVNPKSDWNTPFGVYSFPLSYILDNSYEGGQIKVPFAGDRNFIHVFASLTENYDITSEDYTDVDFEHDVERLCILYYDTIDEWLDEDNETPPNEDKIFHYIKTDADDHAHVPTPFGKIWRATRTVAYIVSDITGRKPIVAWNKIFRDLGIMGAVDYGTSVIHESEPTQAVHFTRETLEHIGTFYNPEYVTDPANDSLNAGPKMLHSLKLF